MRRLFLFHLRQKYILDIVSIHLNGNFYDLEQIAVDELLFSKLLEIQNITYRYEQGYSWTKSAKIDFVRIDKEIDYSARIQLLENGSAYFQRNTDVFNKKNQSEIFEIKGANKEIQIRRNT